jgi:hypothetical protein
MREIWASENARVFNNELPKPVFVVKHMSAEAGLWNTTKSGKHRITIDNRFCKTKKLVHRVMLHEMIHQLQDLQKSPRTIAEHHGRFFQGHMFRILAEISILPYWPT